MTDEERTGYGSGDPAFRKRLEEAAGDGTPDDPKEDTSDAPRCDLCGYPMLERHCKLLCLQCGYQRDCTDP